MLFILCPSAVSHFANRICMTAESGYLLMRVIQMSMMMLLPLQKLVHLLVIVLWHITQEEVSNL